MIEDISPDDLVTSTEIDVSKEAKTAALNRAVKASLIDFFVVAKERSVEDVVDYLNRDILVKKEHAENGKVKINWDNINFEVPVGEKFGDWLWKHHPIKVHKMRRY